MPYLIVLAAGFILGKEWRRVRRAIDPVSDAASARFDQLYSGVARDVGQKVEYLEDRIAMRQARSAGR
ncbi:hypothetical protein [Caulobacter sp. FWC2]|uniref:hypothetical protein n=1 Tax=Caulobacter sp. FWC2 TaxID=69664 RepID=UPI000C1599D0|nr:hypothetical protein [Caulobacter sp. FWC2]PIB92763.1 hypothetical protein CSW62_15025 [Caulobacter sp. FWC2]